MANNPLPGRASLAFGGKVNRQLTVKKAPTYSPAYAFVERGTARLTGFQMRMEIE